MSRSTPRVRVRLTEALWALPLFVFGGFVIPMGVEAVRSFAGRRMRLELPHILGLIIASYLVVSWWLIRPQHLAFHESFHDFVRWQFREVIPILAVLVTVYVRPVREVNRYVRAVLVVGAVIGVVGGLEYLEVLVTHKQVSFLHLVRFDPSGFYLFGGWMRAHNAAGAVYAALAAASLWWYFERRLPFWVLGANVLALGLTLSRSGYAGFVIVAAVYFLMSGRLSRRRRLAAAIGMAVGLLVLVGPLYDRFLQALSPTDYNWVSRMQVWHRAIHDFAKSPFIGIGWGNFQPVPGDHAHNSYLQVLAELGLIGFTLIGVWLVSVGFELYRRRRYDLLGAMGTVMISSLLDHNFGSPTITAPLFLLAGMAITSRRTPQLGVFTPPARVSTRRPHPGWNR